ncbi:MAG: ABC transporter permease [Vicinamibacterales bacterium]
MHSFFRDVVHAYRSLRAAPAAAVAAAVTIALGTGVNTAVFAVAHGVLLRPLPCPEPSRVVVVSLHAPNGNEFGVPLTEIEDWRRRVRAFDASAAYSVAELTVRGVGEPRLVRTAIVTPSFFEVLRVAPRSGRAPSDSDPGQWMVLGAQLSRQLESSGQSPTAAIGRAVAAGEKVFEVSAIMPAGFPFPAEDVAAWVPAASLGRIRLASGKEIPRTFRVMARLKDGVSIEQARDDAQRAFSEVATTRQDRGTTQLRTLDDVLFSKVRPALNALVVAAVLVLLVACGNVATLLVSRAVARRSDLAVRLSLGASSWQLARTALAESLLVVAAGSALGTVLALVCVRLFVRTATGVVPRLDAIALDAPVLAATALVAFLVTVICGLAPAVHAVCSDFSPTLRSSHSSASRRVRLTRRTIIIAQVAMSVVLLSGAGLIGRTVFGLLADRAGADPDHALVVKLSLADSARFDLESRMPTIREMLRRVRELPGVEHAALGTNIPPRVAQISFSVQVTSNGRTVNHTVHLASVTSGFFEALGTRVIEGHAIDEADEMRDGPVIVLSESAARLLSPDRSLVGSELPWPLPAGAGKGRKPLVAGIVPDVKYGGLDAPALAAIYTRWVDLPASVGHLLVRTTGDPGLLEATLRKTLREVDPSLPMTEIRTLREEYATSIAGPRARLIPAAGFAVLAVAVALVGLGGMLTRAVAERRRELAIRTVLGASPGGAVRAIMREGILVATAGLALGLAAGAASARWLQSLLYGVSPLDPLTFAGVALLVSAAALATSFLSARRAARIEPLELLRSE